MTNIIVHRHTIDNIVGYVIQQTIVEDDVLGMDGPIVDTVDDPCQYLQAIKIARALKKYDEFGIKSYGLVHARYACGCTDLDF